MYLGNCFSSRAKISYGVPQGSILGPILFSLYMLPLSYIFQKHKLSYHLYADDTQLYFPVKNNNCYMSTLFACLQDIKCWMDLNFLQLNNDKTEIMVFGPTAVSSGIVKQLGPLSSNVRDRVRNLGMVFDPTLSFDKQISTVVKSSFFQLRSIARIKKMLSMKDLQTIIHAFITSRLDYCNSLFLGLPKSSLNRLQLVQNEAARLLTGTRKREHITPVLASLHWLPVKFRVDLKILPFVFKALHGYAPQYICNLLIPHSTSRSLQSSSQFLLSVPRSHFKTKGDRAFAVAAPRLWNSIPLHIRSSPSISLFKSALKTHFYSVSFNSV